MPQFDPTSFPSQLFWLAVTFAILYLLMAKLALPRIGDLLAERRRKIDEALDAATRLTAEARGAEAEYEAALADARHHARQMIGEAAERAAHLAAARRGDFERRLDERVNAAEARIAAAKTEAAAELDAFCPELADAIVRRLAAPARPPERGRPGRR